MVLKGRLKLVYDFIPPCGVLADIGTDHALVPAYALLNGRCRKAIACDVRKGPLERAKRTLEQYGLGGRMELRMGSGLEPLLEQEADCIVLAGMGGILITELLKQSMRKAQTADCLILQPMVGQEVIRPFLWKNGFEVLDEALAKEGEKLYQALLVHYSGTVRNSWDRVNAVIGEHLIQKKDPLLREWILDRIKKQKKIVFGLSSATTCQESLESEKKLLAGLDSLLKSLETAAGRML